MKYALKKWNLVHVKFFTKKLRKNNFLWLVTLSLFFIFSQYTDMERMEQQRANDMSEIDQKLKDNFNKMEELTDILRKMAKNK